MIKDKLISKMREVQTRLLNRNDVETKMEIHLSQADFDQLTERSLLFGYEFYFFHSLAILDPKLDQSFLILKYRDLEISREILN